MVFILIPIVLYLGWFVYRLGVGKRKREEEKAYVESLKKKDPSEWTENDRKLLLKDLEKYRSHLTFQQYDVLHAKYSGTTSVTEMALKAGVSPTQTLQNRGGSNTNTKNKKDGTKTIVKDAAIGGIVAGPAGAVVGAIVGKNKVDNESNNNN